MRGPVVPARRPIISAPVLSMRSGAFLVVCGALVLAAASTASCRRAVSAQALPATAPRQAAPVPGRGLDLLATIRALTASGMEGRGTGTDGGARARAWIVDRLDARRVQTVPGAARTQSFTFASRSGQTITGHNVLGYCAGTDAQAPAFVVSAHYDHLGVRNGDTYHGADDNASGVAMLLTVAERCAATPYRHALVLAFFDAEEHGLRGARAFVEKPPVPLDRLALNINFDMVSRSDKREIYAVGPGRWPKLRPLLVPVATHATIAVRFGHDTGGGQDDWTTQSDHGAFHDKGVPFVYFGVEDHADYHKPTDTADKIAPGFLDGVAAVVLESLAALDRASVFK